MASSAAAGASGCLPRASLPSLPSLSDVHLLRPGSFDLSKKLSDLHVHFSGLPRSLGGSGLGSGLDTSSEAGAFSSSSASSHVGSGTGRRMADPGGGSGLAGRLFRCGCLHDDHEPPEITYCVVDAAGTLSLQAVPPALPMPNEEELNEKFAQLVVSYNVSYVETG